MAVPLFDTRTPLAPIRGEIDAAIAGVVDPSFTFYASAEAIPHTGARPVFCDVDPDTMCVTADPVRAALTPDTKAVIAVHLFGNVAPVAEVAALGIPVIEDA